jgi:hypothetical protein
VSPTPKCSDQCSFECSRKVWRWLQYEPKNVANVVCFINIWRVVFDCVHIPNFVYIHGCLKIFPCSMERRCLVLGLPRCNVIYIVFFVSFLGRNKRRRNVLPDALTAFRRTQRVGYQSMAAVRQTTAYKINFRKSNKNLVGNNIL